MNTTNELQSEFDRFELQLPQQIKDYLKEAAKWANFLAILGFIGIGLMVLLGLFFAIFMGFMNDSLGQANPYSSLGIGQGMLGLVYIIMALFYFFPVLYMYKFAKKMKDALYSNSTEQLTDSFKNLKSLFKFMGVLSLVIIGGYVLIFLFAAIGAALF